MYFIPTPSFLKEYFANCHLHRPSELQNLRCRIIFNKNNKIVLCKQLIDFFENEFVESDYLNTYQAFLLEILDNDENHYKIIIDDQQDLNKLLESIRDSFFYEFFSIIDESKSDNLSGSNIYYIQDTENCTTNDFMLKLLADNIVSYEAREFSSNLLIKKMIHFILRFGNYYQAAYCFDRYCNFRHSSLLNYASNLKEFHIFTFRENNKNSNKTAELYKKFKNCRVNYTSDSFYLHERKIIVGDFVITADDDFQNLKRERKTWRVTISRNDIDKPCIKSKFAGFEFVKNIY